MAEIYETPGPASATPQAATRGAAHSTSASTTTFWWEAEGTYYLGLDGEKRPIESSPPTPAIARVRDRPAGARRSRRRRGSWPTTCGRGGASARCRPTTRPTTRSATTRARSGRTTTRSSPVGSGATASYRSRDRRPGDLRRRRALRRDPPPGAVRGPDPPARQRSRSSTSRRTCPRPGRPARSSGLSRAVRDPGDHGRAGSRLYVDPALPDWLPRPHDQQPPGRRRRAVAARSRTARSRSCRTRARSRSSTDDPPRTRWAAGGRPEEEGRSAVRRPDGRRSERSALDSAAGDAADEVPLEAEEHDDRDDHRDEGRGREELPAATERRREVGQHHRQRMVLRARARGRPAPPAGRSRPTGTGR